MATAHANGPDGGWKSVYLLGGSAALISVVLVLLDILVSTMLPEGEVRPGARAAIDWFTLLQDQGAYGLRDLGILNILNVLLGIPLFLALGAAHRRVNPGYAMLAGVLFVFGGAIYIANNPAVPLVVLSQHYAAATSDAQRSVLAAAGEALLAQGADFTPGSWPGLVVPLVAQIVMALVMLRGGVFGRVTAWAGIAGFACLLIFTVVVICVPGSFDVVMLIAVPGGLLTIAWNILVARRLFQLGHESAALSPAPAAPRSAL